MNRSPLHERHESLGARMAPFAGWEMPIQYAGIVTEHRAVRERVGVFDISHMGEFEVRGETAGDWLNRLLTNDTSRLEDGKGQYTLMLNERGGVIDDLILFRFAEDCYFLVVNAARIQEDLDWLEARRPAGIKLEDRSQELGALAVQGPRSEECWERVAPGAGVPERNERRYLDDGTIICGTGYTGEKGFELFASRELIVGWFDRLLEAGAEPCGLGARDTLRLEKCLPLNGADLDEDHNPLEAGLAPFVKLDKAGGFTASEVLLSAKLEGVESKLCAIALTGKAPPPRGGYEVRDAEGEKAVGALTSGSLSPSLGKGIGMAYLPVTLSKRGTALTVIIRDRPYPAEVVKKPFL